jgi:hypothetical protein
MNGCAWKFWKVRLMLPALNTVLEEQWYENMIGATMLDSGWSGMLFMLFVLFGLKM